MSHFLLSFKGKGQMFTYFLEKNERKSVWEIVGKSRQGDQTIDGYAELHTDNGGELSELTAEKIAELKQKKQEKMENGYSHEMINGTSRVEENRISTPKMTSPLCVLL